MWFKSLLNDFRLSCKYCTVLRCYRLIVFFFLFIFLLAIFTNVGFACIEYVIWLLFRVTKNEFIMRTTPQDKTSVTIKQHRLQLFNACDFTAMMVWHLALECQIQLKWRCKRTTFLGTKNHFIYFTLIYSVFLHATESKTIVCSIYIMRTRFDLENNYHLNKYMKPLSHSLVIYKMWNLFFSSWKKKFFFCFFAFVNADLYLLCKVFFNKFFREFKVSCEMHCAILTCPLFYFLQIYTRKLKLFFSFLCIILTSNVYVTHCKFTVSAHLTTDDITLSKTSSSWSSNRFRMWHWLLNAKTLPLSYDKHDTGSSKPVYLFIELNGNFRWRIFFVVVLRVWWMWSKSLHFCTCIMKVSNQSLNELNYFIGH